MSMSLDDLRLRVRQRATGTIAGALFDMVDQFLYSFPGRATTAPFVRDGNNTQRLYNRLVIATVPCWLFGVWNLGEQTNFALFNTGAQTASGWRGWLLSSLGVGIDHTSLVACVLHGLLYFVPIFLVALITGALWEAVFAARRSRPVDEGLLSVAWLFALILPATVPLYQVAIGMTCAIVFGRAIFGGTGRYLVNPALLGLAFLVFSYANVIYGVGAWIPVAGYDEPTTIELAADEGGVTALTSVGYTWWQLFIGNQPGPIGVTSALGCLIGAVYLVLTGAASWRIMLGSCAGMITTVLLLSALGPTDSALHDMPWHWHFVIGGWLFGTVFVATDPVAAAHTNPGRWGFGFLVGALTIVVRITNPAYYEGVIFAILLASVFSPLLDYAVVQANIRRRERRLREMA